MDEVKIHSGTQIKLKRVADSDIPSEFLVRLQELAHREEAVQAAYLFAIELPGKEEQISLALAVKGRLFRKADEEFLRIVQEIQLILPEDLSVNLYRFESSPPVASYCLKTLEPVYLRSAAWRQAQLKKLG